MSDIDFDYRLDKNSIVFDVGGFHGDFTRHIRSTFGCGVHVFEPVHKHFAFILKRFELEPMVWPYNVAFEDLDEKRNIHLSDNSSSLYGTCNAIELIRVRDIAKFIEAFKLNRIDLVKLNCEGSEYRIFNRLHQKGWLPKVNQIVVQFHEIPEFSKPAYEEKLLETHILKYKDDHWQWYQNKNPL